MNTSQNNAVNGKELTIFNFNGNEVRNIVIDDKPYFIAKDVCDVLSIQNVTQAISRLDDDERSMFNIGRQGEVNIINESGLYKLIFTSNKPEAKAFTKWVTDEVLPAIRKTGKYEQKVNYDDLSDKAKLELETMSVMFEALRLPDSGKALVFKKFYDFYGLNTNLIPAYFDEEITESLTALIKKNGLRTSAQRVNKLLIAKGILEVKTRPSSKGGIKYFHSLTNSGLKYGKNIISKENPKETQPHYYEKTFNELMDIVGA